MTTFKRRTDITRDEIMKQVCELNGMEYVPPKNRKSVNCIEILDDDGEPFIITKDGVVIKNMLMRRLYKTLNNMMSTMKWSGLYYDKSYRKHINY